MMIFKSFRTAVTMQGKMRAWLQRKEVEAIQAEAAKVGAGVGVPREGSVMLRRDQGMTCPSRKCLTSIALLSLGSQITAAPRGILSCQLSHVGLLHVTVVWTRWPPPLLLSLSLCLPQAC